ncbi:hypothetical protein SAMN05660653_02940 [Desulfonatronum thiosulfatophilum]|uniref:Uncharacterized protein n=1 Tax=Desulfonatronum thiosulfatophilum TaxID=617002 RepID=A0A1G6EMT0_9BACT|nr:hypothetical protein SAMN05660653_02940 [Desulfonatronum thiosulfatophilum]
MRSVFALARCLPPYARKRLKEFLLALTSQVHQERLVPEPVDFRGVLSDPFEALSRVDPRQPVLVNVPLERCRTLGPVGFPPLAEAHHPYVLAMLEYLESNIQQYDESPLKLYFDHFQPQNAAELADVPGVDNDSNLHRKEAIELDFPWLASPGLEVKSMRNKFLRDDAAQFGKQLSGDDGLNYFGPVSSAKADLEMERVVYIIDSIKRNGYRVPAKQDHISGYLLKKGDSYVALPWGGQHRLAALGALGFRHAPFLLYRHRVTDRASVKSWPAVTSGDFSPEQALHLFDRIFAGRQPQQVEKVWPDVLKGCHHKINDDWQ